VALRRASEVEAAVGIGVAVPGASGVAVPRPSGVEAAVGTDEASSCGRLGKLRPLDRVRSMWRRRASTLSTLSSVPVVVA